MIAKKKDLVWVLTNRGFGSEINNLLYAKNYANNNNLNLKVNSSFWNFSIKNGLEDYFNYFEKNNWRINILMIFFKNYFSPLTHCFQKSSLKTIAKYWIKKYILRRNINYPLNETILTYIFLFTKSLLGIKSIFIFEVFKEIRTYNHLDRLNNKDTFNKKMNNFLSEIWNFQPSIKYLIEKKIKNTELDLTKPYATFHIRRGDKVAASTKEDRVYEVEEYMEKLMKAKKNITTIFLMSDDYSVYLELVNKFPEHNFYTFLEPDLLGHDQNRFNKQSREFKMKQAINLLTEIKMAEESSLFIGSSGSNIYRLIEYLKLNKCYDLSNSNEI